jgi:hypothetical protein
MEEPNDPVEAASDIANPSYAYKSSVMGAPFEFILTPDAIEWQKGPRRGRAPYGRIRRIRLGFRPMTMQNYRFLAEVWVADGPKLMVASSSWKSLFEQERLDAPYRAFVGELARRVGAARANTVFETGSPPILYWLGVIVFAAAGLSLAALTVRALQTQAWSGALFVLAFLALFLWQAGTFFRRNRPGTFDPNAIPETVLPRA